MIDLGRSGSLAGRPACTSRIGGPSSAIPARASRAGRRIPIRCWIESGPPGGPNTSRIPQARRLLGGLLPLPRTGRRRRPRQPAGLARPHSVVVLNRFPYNNGHLLVAPRVHRGTLGELSGPDLARTDRDHPQDDHVLDRMLRPQGYNIGLNQGKAAGAGLPGHLHWHIVPRWDGDTNFMPVLGQTKVIVESLTSSTTASWRRFGSSTVPASPR